MERPLSAKEFGYLQRRLDDAETSMTHFLMGRAEMLERGVTTVSSFALDRDRYVAWKAIVDGLRSRLDLRLDRWPDTLDEALSTALRDHAGG